MEDNGFTSLDSEFNSQSEAAPVEQTSMEQQPVEQIEQMQPEGTGETHSAPPAANQPEPDHVPRAAVMDERRKRQEAERQALELRRTVEQLQAQQRQVQVQPQATQAQQPKGPLKLEQFATPEEYLEAVADQKAQLRAAEIFETKMREAQQYQQEQTLRQQTASDLSEMVDAGNAKYQDYLHVVTSMPLSDTMMNAALALEAGHEVLYHLGQNPAEADRIFRLHPSAQAREIGKVARQISVPPAAPVVPPLPKTLAQTRSATGQFTKSWTGPTPLTDIFKRN